ncbi:uncharacterized protein LOC131842804 [Achroia grisella]|uniref:uncharacterized protein LOC131842804 n=1 Tax=Achroia grisella TaxID=688607 RepID=UPI0027D2CF92|nr:uncharacterized protein LOC131842804 [Achroia grisella]
MATQCSSCHHKLPNREHLVCTICNNIYDLECANVSVQHFYNTMTLSHKKKWKCKKCKTTNIPDSTPITNNTKSTQLNPNSSVRQYIGTPQSESNITIRKKVALSNRLESSDKFRETLHSSKSIENTELNMVSIDEIITSRLEENNTILSSDLKNIMKSEIDKAVEKIINNLKENLGQPINNIYKQNEKINTDIDQINTDIEQLTQENNKLKKELRELQIKMSNPGNYYDKLQNNSRKIVLYGFTEYNREHETDTYNRLLQTFQDIANINLVGYIDDIYRLGKKYNTNRPLVIELLSKKMVKYIINSSRYFYGTGLYISEYLDRDAQKEKMALREQMFLSRNRGNHAIIRNNQLFVDGKRINWQKKEKTIFETSNGEEHDNTVEFNNSQINLATNNNRISTFRTFRKNRSVL